MAETIAIPEYARGATLEDIWAVLRENAEQFKKIEKIQKETAESMKETDKRLKKTERIVRRNGKQMGDLHNRFGQLAEHLVAPNINKRFNELGYHFGIVAPGGIKIEDENGKVKTEIDLLLENGQIIMAVEVKTRPVVKDVEHHLKRLEILREYKDKLHDSRKVQGAIAGAVFGSSEKKAVLEAGLYVIEQSGDTMKIEVPQDFIPREW